MATSDNNCCREIRRRFIAGSCTYHAPCTYHGALQSMSLLIQRADEALLSASKQFFLLHYQHFPKVVAFCPEESSTDDRLHPASSVASSVTFHPSFEHHPSVEDRPTPHPVRPSVTTKRIRRMSRAFHSITPWILLTGKPALRALCSETLEKHLNGLPWLRPVVRPSNNFGFITALYAHFCVSYKTMKKPEMLLGQGFVLFSP